MASCSINQSLIADGCQIGEGTTLDRCVLGMRAQVGRNVVLKNAVVMGADFYPTTDDPLFATGVNPVWGIGDGAYIDGALLDKNVSIGRGARIVASEAPSGTATLRTSLCETGLLWFARTPESRTTGASQLVNWLHGSAVWQSMTKTKKAR